MQGHHAMPTARGELVRQTIAALVVLGLAWSLSNVVTATEDFVAEVVDEV
jgi:hypothetical protein